MRDIDRTPEADLLNLQPGDNGEQVAYRPRQPVELGDGKAVALAHVVECRLKLLALGNRRNLLAEYLVTPGRLKVAMHGHSASGPLNPPSGFESPGRRLWKCPASKLLMISEKLRETKAQRVQALGSSGVPQLLGDNVIDMPYAGYPP